MYTKKGIILIIIIVLLAITVIGGTAVFVIYKTDLFKSNETLFYKYLGKEIDNVEQLRSEKLMKNISDTYGNSYTKKGKFSVSYSNPNSKNVEDALEKTNVHITGEKNLEQKRAVSTYDVQYNDESIFELQTKHDDDIYAVTSPQVINSFLGIENKELDKLFSRLNLQYNDAVESSIPVENYSEVFNFSDSEKQVIQNLIVKTLDSIDESKYSKNTGVMVKVGDQEEKVKEYTISLTGNELKELYIKLCNNIQEDSNVLQVIANKAKLIGLTSGYTNVESLKANINEYVSTITNLATTDKEIIRISVYQKSGEVVGAEIKTFDNDGYGKYTINITTNINNNTSIAQININTIEANIATIKISKIENENNTTYNVAVSNDSSLKFELYFENSGKLENSQIENKINLTYSKENISFGINYENTFEFGNNPNIEGLDNTNCAILNNYDKETVQNFFISIEEKILTVYTDILSKVGIETDLTIEKIQAQAQAERDELSRQQQQADEELNKAAESLQNTNLTESEKQNYNNEIEKYLGDEKEGSQVSSMIEKVMSLITTYPDRNIIIRYEDEDYSYAAMSNLKSKFKDNVKYKVVGEKNTGTGIYNKIIITEVSQQ